MLHTADFWFFFSRVPANYLLIVLRRADRVSLTCSGPIGVIYPPLGLVHT